MEGEHKHRSGTPPNNSRDWWFLLIAWREAQGLLLDADFPAEPFAH